MNRSAWVQAAAVLAMAVTGAFPAGCRPAATEAPAPPDVTVARPVAQTVTDALEFTGNTAATNAVTVVARVEGYLEQIHVADGASVKRGDLLFTIQRAQYDAQLKQAEAQVEAQRAALRHAKTELGRYATLVTQDAATQTTVDHWRYEKAAASAALASALAQLDLARLTLSYTLVRAPFDGRMGRHLVDVGTLVGGMGQPTALAEVTQIDPIYVYFTIDERDLLRVMARGEADAPGAIAAQTVPGYFGLLDEEGYPHEGRLDFASITVSATTGTLQVRGIFPNPDRRVLPGLFVRVRVPALHSRQALVIPGDAISFDQQGEYVLVVNAQNVVERRSVKTGQQIGTALVVEDGLRPDDRVIVEGALQAIPGRPVTTHAASEP